jgi:hypothetical protein
MRNSGNISWPHPVLGNSDDIEGSFQVKITGSITDQVLSLKSEDLEIDNDYFKSLIDGEKAVVLFKISCNSTLYTSQFEGELENSIDCTLISNILNIDVLIVAKENIDDYSDDSFHEDTLLGINKGVFKIRKGTIIGAAGSISFPLNNEFRQGIAGIIEFQENDADEPISIDADGSKIVVKYPDSPNSQNMITTFTTGRKQFINTFINLFIIPALSEAFRILIVAKTNNEYDDKVDECDWARVIDENIIDPISTSDNPFELAQEFLRLMSEKKSGIAEEVPVFKAFNEIYK